jgi:hypothetical protein
MVHLFGWSSRPVPIKHYNVEVHQQYLRKFCPQPPKEKSAEWEGQAILGMAAISMFTYVLIVLAAASL